MSRNNDETAPSFTVSEHSKLKLPLSLQVILFGAVATVATAWALNRRDVSDLNARIGAVESARTADHDVLVEIRSDVKRLVREEDRRRP